VAAKVYLLLSPYLISTSLDVIRAWMTPWPLLTLETTSVVSMVSFLMIAKACELLIHMCTSVHKISTKSWLDINSHVLSFAPSLPCLFACLWCLPFVIHTFRDFPQWVIILLGGKEGVHPESGDYSLPDFSFRITLHGLVCILWW
jgi:hypothetical protein